MKSSTKRILSIFFSFVFMIGTVILYVSFIRPELTVIDTMRSENATKEKQKIDNQNIVAKAKEIIAKYQNETGLKDTASLALPVGENVPHALAQINAIIKNSGATLTNMSFKIAGLEKSTKVYAKRMGRLEVSCEAQGSYDAVKTFIRMVESNVRVSNINTLTITEGTQGEDTYKTSLAFSMYYQEE